MINNKPNIEIEYKFKVEDKDSLVSLLDGLADAKKLREYQSNVMFDNLQETMQNTNGRIRVRKIGIKGKKELTYKKPLSSKNGAKREIEYEIEFSDSNTQIENILYEMCFMPKSSYELYRTEWRIRNVQVTLDEYPYGNYIEIEGNEEEIQIVAKELNYDVSKGITKPTDTLFQEWRKERGLPVKLHMRFDDFDK